MGDATSDLGEDVDEATAPTCAVCGEPIVESATHRVVSWVEDGTARTMHFCGGACRETWLADHDPRE